MKDPLYTSSIEQLETLTNFYESFLFEKRKALIESDLYFFRNKPKTIIEKYYAKKTANYLLKTLQIGKEINAIISQLKQIDSNYYLEEEKENHLEIYKIKNAFPNGKNSVIEIPFQFDSLEARIYVSEKLHKAFKELLVIENWNRKVKKFIEKLNK